jgi:mitogen-activated protein kinase kinase kinase 7
MRGGLDLKICDFGATCDTHSIMTMDKGTPLYIAPEVLSSRLVFFQIDFKLHTGVSIDTDYNEKCDVFSYGIIFWELLTRRRPYEHKKLKSVQILMAVKDLGE